MRWHWCAQDEKVSFCLPYLIDGCGVRDTPCLCRIYETNAIIKICPKCDGQGPDLVWLIRQSLTVPSHPGGADQPKRGGKEVLRKGTVCEKAWRYARECQTISSGKW